MNSHTRCLPKSGCLLLFAALLQAQGTRPEPGHSIGSISTQGNLIVFTLNDGALGKSNLFDLAGRTVRFTPDGAGYRIENGPLQWDPEPGPEMTGGQVTLKNFTFPF
jgi:hypothetical protein